MAGALAGRVCIVANSITVKVLGLGGEAEPPNGQLIDPYQKQRNKVPAYVAFFV
jgi:hypothetical protein